MTFYPRQSVELLRANKVTGPNAGGPLRFAARALQTARVGQFCR